jgi:hypothetical protein
MDNIVKTFRGKRNFINDCVIEYLDFLSRKGVGVQSYTVDYATTDSVLCGTLTIKTERGE